ncbi:MAG: (2Fe-2S) ferredoxin domain-containing protein [Chrysiogenales bacterium]|nr:MAG: (2Fe-2S) ferredoxin domain-containing protein [Chrysiogenales bacterium]
MAKLKIEDLKKIREKAQGTVTMREGTHRVKITVHMGTCGIAAGARKIMGVFLEEINARGTSDVVLTTSGCAGLCSREPMATVEIRGAAPVKYVDLDEAKTKRVFEEHVLDDKPVAEFALVQGSETTY